MISFVVLNWNTAKLTQGVIDSLARQTCRQFEVIVVDNGSSEPLSLCVPDWMLLRKLRHERNLGFAEGMNSGLAEAQGRLLCAANSDVIFSQNFVKRALALGLNPPPRDPSKRRVGIIGGLSLTADALPLLEDETHDIPLELIETTATTLTWQGRLIPVRRDAWRTSRHCFGVTGAFPVFIREFYEAVSVDGALYDPVYHSYSEDIDLFMRAYTHGYCSFYSPELRAVHLGSMSTSGNLSFFSKPSWLQRQILRNMTWNWWKNFTGLELLAYLPLYLINVAATLALAMVPGVGVSPRAIVAGFLVDPFRPLGAVLRMRRSVQCRPFCDIGLLRLALLTCLRRKIVTHRKDLGV